MKSRCIGVLTAILALSACGGSGTDSVPRAADSSPSTAPSVSPTASLTPAAFIVPAYTSAAQCDTAFAASVAPLGSWNSMYAATAAFAQGASYGSIAEARTAVVAAAQRVCTALDTAGLETIAGQDPLLRSTLDQVDDVAFMVQAATFYCPKHVSTVSNGVYTLTSPSPQTYDCPAAPLEVSSRITDDSLGSYVNYEVVVTNSSSYEVLARLEEKWTAPDFSGEWGSVQALGIGSGDFVRLDPGGVETLTGSQPASTTGVGSRHASRRASSWRSSAATRLARDMGLATRAAGAGSFGHGLRDAATVEPRTCRTCTRLG